MMKCMECSYTTNDKDKKYCPYDGSELVEADSPSNGSEAMDYDEEFDDYN